MTHESARLRAKTWLGTAVVVTSNVFGNFFLKRGMNGEMNSPLDYLAALFRPYVALGVVLLIVFLLSRMALFSWADLSYVVPVTSVGYILTALVAKALLHEQIGGKRWLGILLIVAGASLVSWKTAPRTSATGEASS
jgi:drug/metabolite transporter (DMT)-like permease